MSTLKTTNLQHASAASPAIVLASDGTATAQLSSLNDGPLSGARNRIINGAMDFWQRGTSTTTSSVYLADRWQAQFPAGGTVSQETTSVPTGSRYAWKYVASATNPFMQMGQQIEYMNCLDLQNTTVAISFMARSVTSNAGSTALTVRTRTIAGIDGTCLFAGSNSDTAITLTTSWTRYTVTRTLPATFGSLSLEFVLGNSHVSGDGIMLSQIQLEAGSVATPFERRSYGQELALCQRYYEKSYDPDVVPGSISYAGRVSGQNPGAGSWDARHIIQFKATKRAAPTINTYRESDGSSGWMTADNLGIQGGLVFKTIVAGQAWFGHWTASAEL